MLDLPRRRRVSVKLNIVLTCVEVSSLLIIIGIGVWAIAWGMGEPGRLLEINTAN